MPDTQPKEQVSRIIPMTADDLIFLQLKDLKDEFRDSRKELNSRMDRIETRQDRIESKIDNLDAKIDDTRKKLADKIDKLSDKIDSSTKHGQILAGSCSAITIAVLLSIFLK